MVSKFSIWDQWRKFCNSECWKQQIWSLHCTACVARHRAVCRNRSPEARRGVESASFPARVCAFQISAAACVPIPSREPTFKPETSEGVYQRRFAGAVKAQFLASIRTIAKTSGMWLWLDFGLSYKGVREPLRLRARGKIPLDPTVKVQNINLLSNQKYINYIFSTTD